MDEVGDYVSLARNMVEIRWYAFRRFSAITLCGTTVVAIVCFWPMLFK